jgi:hypothetical protein
MYLDCGTTRKPWSGRAKERDRQIRWGIGGFVRSNKDFTFYSR